VTTIFAFDTATSTATCALVRDGEVLGERETEARALLADADRLLRAAGLEPADLDAVVAGIGPGSFTSIRMGLAAVRGLGLVLDLRAAGVSSLHAFAGGEPVIDARRGEVFTSGPTVSRPEELAVAGRRLVGDGAVRYRAVFEAAGAEVPPDDDPDHRPRAHLLVAHVADWTTPDRIEPLYGRQPDAVAKT
jgi:tRNA threonylcarbamoyl adenosine modification protein YeaZ